MNVAALVAAVVIVTVTPAAAQIALPRDPPADFWIASYVDRAVVMDDGRVLLQGWSFDCRTGLQPATQRIGSVTVHYSAPGGQRYIPDTFQLWGGGERPDVASVYAPHCPSVGPFVGYGIIATAPPAGVWTVTVSWVAFDGAGRQTPPHASSAAITVR